MDEHMDELIDQLADKIILEEEDLNDKPKKKRGKRKSSGKHAEQFHGICNVVKIGLVLALVVFLGYNLKEIGDGAGEALGTVAGFANGSFQGITEGIPSGMEEGKRQGLSAEDTMVDFVTQIEEVGKLEVLCADVSLTDNLEVKKAYKALYVYMADVVFTVDLKNADIEKNGNQVIVKLDLPTADIYIREDETEKLAELQKHFYSGKTEDGIEAYINSRARVEENAIEKMENYDTLQKLAQDSAEKQIEILVESICGKSTEVKVLFADREGA